MADNKNTTVIEDITHNAIDSAKKVMFANLARAVSNKMATDPTLTQRLAHASVVNAAYAATEPGTVANSITRGLAFGMNVCAIEDLLVVAQSEISNLGKDASNLFAETWTGEPESEKHQTVHDTKSPVSRVFSPDTDIKYSKAVENKGVVATPEVAAMLEKQTGAMVPSSNALPMPEVIDTTATNRGKLEAKLNENTVTPPANNNKVVCAKCGADVKKNKSQLFLGKEGDPEDVKAMDKQRVCNKCADILVKTREAAAKAAATELKNMQKLIDAEGALETANKNLAIAEGSAAAMEVALKAASPEVATALSGQYETIKASVVKGTARIAELQKEIERLNGLLKN